jgi:hypothetical protein
MVQQERKKEGLRRCGKEQLGELGKKVKPGRIYRYGDFEKRVMGVIFVASSGRVIANAMSKRRESIMKEVTFS